MYQFTNKKQRADFGRLGSVDQGSYHDDGDSELDAGTEDKKKKSDASGALDPTTSMITQALGSLCDCANKDKDAEAKKKAELQKKYPLRDCGPNPTAACTAYNEQMKKLQDQEFTAWQAAKDAQTGAALPPSDQQRFAFVSTLAKQLKAAHPEAGSMTLSQIYKTYPDDFDRIYEQLKQQFPFLKNLDPATALAMNPGIAGMTLDQLIAKTSALSNGLAGSSSGSSSAAGIGMLAAAGAAVLLLLKLRK